MLATEKRRMLGLLMGLTLCAAVLVTLAPSPARASYYESGVSLSTEIVRDGVTYTLNVKALQAMSGSRLELSISSSSDAAGTSLRQIQTWNFPLGPGEFTQEWATYYRIDAGSETGPFQVDLVVERRQDTLCSEGQDLFVTVQEGGFRVETGNEIFDAITEVPTCAAAWSFSSGPPPPGRCPLRGQQLTSSSLNVKERHYSDVARLNVYLAQERTVPGGSVQWELDVSGTVPASIFTLNRDLEAAFKASGLPWLSGTARFEPVRPADRGEWFDCRGGREARTLSAKGSVTGDLMVDVIGYESHTVAEPEAWAQRSHVRPRR